MAENLVDALRSALPRLRIDQDPGTCQEYGRDWTRLHEPAPAAVVFPASVQEVRELVRFANENGVALVPSGGRTGYSGGAVAANGELVVSMDRLNRIGEWNPLDRTVTVEAGVVTQRVQEFAREQGLCYPVDFASSGSSQIGGNVATNAGGIHVLRHGLTREQVAGLKVVTGTGELMELGRGLVKDATGYNLMHLMIGSEGTLGIIVEVILRLREPPPEQAVMLMALPDMSSVMKVFAAARSTLRLSAYEFFSDLALEKVLTRTDARSPFEQRAAYYVLAEFDQDESAALAVFESVAEREWVVDGVISQSGSQAEELWQLRERISESISHDLPYKNDLAVRISDVEPFLAELDAMVRRAYPDFEVVWFGHIGDGNLHLNILKPADLELDQFTAACEKVNEQVYGLVERYGGSISAEHGVGLVKKPYLRHSRTPAEIDYIASIKQLFDPQGILNPGKLLD